MKAAAEEKKRRESVIHEMSLFTYLLALEEEHFLGEKVKVSCKVEDMQFKRDLFEHITDPLVTLLLGFSVWSYSDIFSACLSDEGDCHDFGKYDNHLLPWQLKKMRADKKRYQELVKKGDDINAILMSERVPGLIGSGMYYRFLGLERNGKNIFL